jgi:hypothetical protein
MGKSSFLMKRILLPLFIFIAETGYSQFPMKSLQKTYFRIHPFDMKFSSFVLTLQNDPWFTVDTYKRRTDSTFFFLSGVYKNFNPFRYVPKELKLVLVEEEIIHSDSLQTRDTIINLQLMGIADTGIASKKMVEKEFKRFHSNQSDKFSNNTYKSLGGKNEITGEIYNYFISPFSIPPVTVAWGFLPGSYQYTFVIKIRFKVVQNVAVYVAGPDEL